MRRILMSLLAVSVLIVWSTLVPVGETYAQEVPREDTLIADFISVRVEAPNDIWNPFTPGANRMTGYHQICMEPLEFPNPMTGEDVPWLAEKWEYNQDFTKLTYHLRRGVKWSDGVPFTADDVVFTYNDILIKNAPKLVYSSEVSAEIGSVDKVDDYTVTFNLKHPNPRAAYMLGYMPVNLWGVPLVAKHIWEGEDPLTFKNVPPVGTGPYKLVSLSETTFVWERWDGWWATEIYHVRPAPKRIIFTGTATAEMKGMKMATHELDDTFNIPPTVMFTALDKNPYIISWSILSPPYGGPDPAPRHLFLNLLKYPYNITEVRRAISYMIDRPKLIEVALEKNARVSVTPVFPLGAALRLNGTIGDLLQKYEFVTYDPEKGKRILESLGFTMGADGVWVMPNGQRFTMELDGPAWSAPEMACVAQISDQLKAGGIDCVWKGLMEGPFFELQATAGYDVQLGWWGGNFVPSEVMMRMHSKYFTAMGESGAGSASNPMRFRNATYDKAAEDFWMTAPGTDEATAAFRKVVEVYYQNVPSVPIFDPYLNCPRDTYYWTGWPSSEDPWIHVSCWWQAYVAVIAGYPSDNANGTWIRGLRPRTVSYATVYFTKDTPKFRGIDLSWYGPAKKGAALRIPEDDADYWIRQGSASFSAPAPEIPTIPTEMIEAIASDVSAVKGDVTTVKGDVTSLSDKVGALAGQMGTLTAAASIEGIAIIVLAIALVVSLRKRT